MTKTKATISFFGGTPPMCDRCEFDDAAVKAVLPNYGQRSLCFECAAVLIEAGLSATADSEAQK